MGSLLFNILSPIVKLFVKKVKFTWEVPFDGEPCVFVCNHDRSSGPLVMALRFPLREESKIWIYAAPLDRKTTPDYVRNDHWWREDSPLAPFYSAVIPPVVSLILPPVLRSVPHIPAYHDARAVITMKESLRAIRDEKKNIVIFPDIPTGYGKYDQEKVNEGFFNILSMYHRLTGKTLKIWPMHLDYAGKAVTVRGPVVWDPGRPLGEQIPELNRQIVKGIFS